MPLLLDRIRENFRARPNRRRNHSETPESSFEGITEPTPFSFGNPSSSEEHTSEETITSSFTTRRSRYNTSDNTQVTEQSYTYSSTYSSTSTNSATNSHILSTRSSYTFTDSDSEPGDDEDDNNHIGSQSAESRSHGPLNTMNNRQPEINTTQRQSMNNRRRNNNFRPSNHGQSSMGRLEHFGTPLERVHARQPVPQLNTEMQDQVGYLDAGHNQHSNFVPRPHHPDFEDAYANRQSIPNFLELLPVIPEASYPYQQQIGSILVVHPQYLPDHHHHHHRRIHVHGGMFLTHEPNNFAFEDIAMTMAIDRALAPTATMEDDSCAVCQELYDMEGHRPVKVPGCVHILGRKCIMRWLKERPANMTCPLCRNKIEIPRVYMSTPHMGHMGDTPGNQM